MPPMAQKLTACTAMVMPALAGLLEGWRATRAPLEPIVAHCLKDATTCDIIEESPGEAEENYDIRTTSQKLHGQSPGAGLSQAGTGGPQDVLSEAKKLEEEILSHIPPPTPKKCMCLCEMIISFFLE